MVDDPLRRGRKLLHGDSGTFCQRFGASPDLIRDLLKHNSGPELRLGLDLLEQAFLSCSALRPVAEGHLLAIAVRANRGSRLRTRLASLFAYTEGDALWLVLREWLTDPRPLTRLALARAVPILAEPNHLTEVRQILIDLMRDPYPEVRNWSTFALAELVELDDDEVRAALIHELKDKDFDAKAEALYGLALRGDPAALPALREVLRSDKVGRLHVRAALALADPALEPLLAPLLEWWDVDVELLEAAIRACGSSAGTP